MRGLIRTVWVATLAIILSGLVMGQQPTQAAERQVWAYYFGWYTGDSWADGRLVDHPAAPYDSRDGGAVGRQIEEAQSAGIDAFIMSWYGPKNDNLTHQVFNMLLDQAAARGFMRVSRSILWMAATTAAWMKSFNRCHTSLMTAPTTRPICGMRGSQ